MSVEERGEQALRRTNERIIRALAEQQYLFHLLVKTLLEKGLIQPGIPVSRWNEAEFQEFLGDYQAKHFPE